MGSCELCGKSVPLIKAVIEGAVLEVCKDCSSFGRVVEETRRKPIRKKHVGELPPETKMEIRSDFGEVIRKSRINKGLTIEELAHKLNEKESVIRRLEGGRLVPSLALGKKIERFFEVEIYVLHEEEDSSGLERVKVSKKTGGATIGDVVKIKHSRGKH